MYPDAPHPGDLPIPEGLFLDNATTPEPPPDAQTSTRPYPEWRHLDGHTWSIRPGHVLDATKCEVYDLTDLRDHLLAHARVLHQQAVADELGTPSLLRWLHNEVDVPRTEALASTTWLNATPLMRLLNQRVARWHASAFDGPEPPTPREAK